VHTVVQGTQPARIVNYVSTRKLQQYIDVDTTSFIAKWVRMAVFEKKMQWHGINVTELMVFWKQVVH